MSWIDAELSRRSAERENSYRKRNATKLASYAVLGAYAALWSRLPMGAADSPELATEFSAVMGSWALTIRKTGEQGRGGSAAGIVDVLPVLGSSAAVLAAVLAACWLHHAMHATRITDYLLVLERNRNDLEALGPVSCYEEYMDQAKLGRWTWTVSAAVAFLGIGVIVLMASGRAESMTHYWLQFAAMLLVGVCLFLGFPWHCRRDANRALASRLLRPLRAAL